MTPIRKGLVELKQVVIPAAKTERSGDHNRAARLGRATDSTRIDLMENVNHALKAHGQLPVRFR